MADTKYSPLLKTTPFVGSASNRVVHRTDSNCPHALEISPNERWYIKDIPHDGNYILCPLCFPQPVDEEAREDQPLEAAPAVKPRRKAAARPAVKKTAAPKSRSTGSRASSATKKKPPKSRPSHS